LFGWFVGILFAIHPIHTEAVACIVGRADVLCCLFYFLSILLYIESCARILPNDALDPNAENDKPEAAVLPSTMITQTCLVVSSAAFMVLSTLSKEIGITTIPILILWELLIVLRRQAGPMPSTIRQKHCPRTVLESVCRCAVVVVSGLAVLVWRFRLHGDSFMYKWSKLENHIQLLPLGFTKCASYAYVHARYFLLFWVPYPLCYDYGFEAWPLIESVYDVRNVTTVTMYLIMLSILAYGIINLHGRSDSVTATESASQQTPISDTAPFTQGASVADEYVVSTLEKLAATLEENGRTKEAEPLRTQAEAIRNRIENATKVGKKKKKVRVNCWDCAFMSRIFCPVYLANTTHAFVKGNGNEEIKSTRQSKSIEAVI
jgi:hypothetical protein